MNWKALAIAFIIIALLEGLLIGYFFKVGTEMIENENECSINICSDYDSYYYDDLEKTCYCFEGTEIKYQEYIK